jgi:hypothetical protein
MMRDPEVILSHRMLFMAHNDPNPPPYVLWTDKQKEKEYSYYSNALTAGNKETIPKFNAVFERVVQGFMDRKLFIGADDVIAQSGCLQNPELCAYVPKVKGGNPFFGLRSVLYRGGDYALWTPPPLPWRRLYNVDSFLRPQSDPTASNQPLWPNRLAKSCT